MKSVVVTLVPALITHLRRLVILRQCGRRLSMSTRVGAKVVSLALHLREKR